MLLNSLSTVGIATQVWNQAARTLTADPATDAGASTLVWTHATRNMTGIGSGALVQLQTAATTIAANAAVNVNPAAGVVRMVSIVVQSGNAGNTQIGLWDGTTFIAQVTVAQGALQGGWTSYSNQTESTRIKNNDGTNTATYILTGGDWHQ